MIEIVYTSLPEVITDDIILNYKNRVNVSTFNEIKLFKNKKAMLSRIFGEILISDFLKKRFNISPDSYEIKRGEKGKPYFFGLDDFYFNISHSGKYVVCAISTKEIGVDIEKRSVTRLSVARRFFHPSEIDFLNSLSESERNVKFYDLWAVKESYLKYIGTGLTQPLRSFEVELKDKPVLSKDGKILPLYIISFSIDDDYSSFVCSELKNVDSITPIQLF